VSPTFLDSVELYVVQPDGSVRTELTGDHSPQSGRAIQSRHFLIPVELITGSAEYYLRVRTSSTLTLGVTLWQPDAYINFVSRENMFYGVLFGLTLTAVVICLIGGGWFRESFYFAMAVFLLCNGLAHFTVNGFDQYLLYPESTHWPDRMLTFSAFAAGVSGVCLYLVFLQPKSFYPRFTVFCWGVAGLSAVAALASLLGYPSPLLSGIGALILLASMFVLTLLMVPHRFTPAMLMLILFVPQLLTLCLQIARNFSLLPMTFWTTHIWAITSMLQIPFVALVVMLRVRAQEKAYLIEKEKTRLHRDLFSMVSHELRTPLAVVSSALANIELQTANSHPELAPRFSRANLGLARLNTLIDNALAEDRLQDEGIQLQRQWITIQELIAQLRELRVIEPPHFLRLHVPDEPLALYADPHWLGLALLNLLDNAVKYSPAGGQIDVIVGRENHMAFIQIIDEGIGIPAEAVGNIFDKFFRADNALKLQGSSGLGLGLFLVQTVVSLHGGQLEYRPNPKGGSIFTCSLPLLV
jgi:signal transduction histidine kinase